MTTTPHDALFKSVFQHPEHAAAELAHRLAPELVAAIDWSTLAVLPGTYVDRKLAEKRSDLLFSARLRAGGERVLLYLLFEHQSSQQPKLALRLLGSMVRIWEQFSNEHPDEPLPPIIPAVLSHTPGGWKAPTRFSGLFSASLGSLADAVVPDFSYAVDDLHRTSDADLQRRALAIQTRLTLFRYIALVSPDLHLDQIRAILKERAPTAEGITMTTIAEKLLAEGEAKGKVEGKAEGKAEAIVLVLRSRGLHVDPQTQARMVGMSIDDLDACLQRAATVTSIDELLDG